MEKDYELNGWLSEYALHYQFSSHMYIEVILLLKFKFKNFYRKFHHFLKCIWIH